MKLPTVDCFCVTYPKDHPWLVYLMRSIELHVTGMRRLVLVLEKQDPVPENLPPWVAVKRCRDFRGTETRDTSAALNLFRTLASRWTTTWKR